MTVRDERRHLVFGWGGAVHASSWLRQPAAREEVEDVFRLARAEGLAIGLRGGGQSYGDASLNEGGICLDVSRLRRVLEWDPSSGVIRIEPGVTVRELWQRVLPDGWWPPVVPGTAFATVGGCAAANVHGKNNWTAGPFGEHVLEFELLLPSGEVRRVRRDENPELFHAAIGGFGLLGCFLSLTLRMRKLGSGLLAVRAQSVGNLREMVAFFSEQAAAADYLVGWVDAFARGGALGRGIVHAARHLGLEEDPRRPSTMPLRAQGSVSLDPRPIRAAWRLIRPFVRQTTVGALNACVYAAARRRGARAYRQPVARFSFPLDAVPDWRLAYGEGGLIEYQSFIPSERAAEVFAAQLELAQRRRMAPYAAAFKRHRRDSFLLSHGVDGFSLGLHFAVVPARRRELIALTAELDRLVVEAGGRLYFAKDCTTTPAVARRFLGAGLERFLRLKAECDPQGLLQTDLFRRLLRS